ncbi:helix-turn-helix domain-containing protein [Aquibacillus rhizosphaerae]|uniref:Helix-turn-helix domain-containing protein n=1 Tax=Aquibacillus rhizosphaerae TaxID=3051431 RepID=A0ABT7L9G1_9BACI|nr:helix-turn-helix domain-containing protein [Aquibacillus sp. LR5S19]MDL4842505.1 helix-turn-helix domain-containing protein [Aquibacillus sp. LR5S19]
MERKTMTVKEVAEYLGVHTDSIYLMVRDNEVPHFKIRAKILFSRDTIDRWIHEQESN